MLHTSLLFAGVLLVAGSLGPSRANKPLQRVYVNRLTRLEGAAPLLADWPQYVQPVKPDARFSAPALLDESHADLAVRAWRYSFNARGVVELPNRLRGDRTALIVVHPWGIDDGQGWKSPQPAGVAFQCTPLKNRLYRKHVRDVVRPLMQSLRKRVRLVMYTLPGKEDPIRAKLYRSIRADTTPKRRKQGLAELEKTLKSFRYRAQPVPKQFALRDRRPAMAEYFNRFPSLDPGPRYNGEGFWDLPIPLVSDLNADPQDFVFYDRDRYPALRRFLKKAGVRHVLLCGYATDKCVCNTTGGYENLRNDFNVFLVGDATLATFPANSSPAHATNAAVSLASLKVLVTQASWITRIADSPAE